MSNNSDFKKENGIFLGGKLLYPWIQRQPHEAKAASLCCVCMYVATNIIDENHNSGCGNMTSPCMLFFY